MSIRISTFTSAAPLRYYDGAQWVGAATLNQSTHAWASLASPSGSVGESLHFCVRPVAPSGNVSVFLMVSLSCSRWVFNASSPLLKPRHYFNKADFGKDGGRPFRHGFFSGGLVRSPAAAMARHN
jgi:hypothetical protein